MGEQSGVVHEGEREGRFGSNEEGVLVQGKLEDLLPWPSSLGGFPGWIEVSESIFMLVYAYFGEPFNVCHIHQSISLLTKIL